MDITNTKNINNDYLMIILFVNRIILSEKHCILGWGELKTLAGYTYILLWTYIRNEMVMVL